MRPFILSETNWGKIKDFDYKLAILPWGATEAHNLHLPYATDNIQVEENQKIVDNIQKPKQEGLPFNEKNTEVVGVSKDSVKSHQSFCCTRGLPAGHL